jgi:hypothetical protein
VAPAAGHNHFPEGGSQVTAAPILDALWLMAVWALPPRRRFSLHLVRDDGAWIALQASATYTLSGLWDAQAVPYQYEPVSGKVTRHKVGFPLAPDLGGEYTLAATDQRHRAVFNGIWDVAYGVQLSGLYFYGSGKRFGTNYGGDLRDLGESNGGAPLAARLRPDGTIVPRNSLVGKPIHRVDLRVRRHFRLAGRAGVDGLLEGFNLFNHANYGSYVTQESNRNYAQPSFNSNIAYQPRMLQLGFRFTF